ncbi:hypothetical protein [Cellulosilyticum sp. I15G10I2]|uniref:hypothetical protein n=1 Tax=Cellulosilyticum sp. I15G10I2 TaxID=1892843 RepID=UPI00085C27B6|nr:hypothetical protein [Cellulosilyticum sp. I15G10I2]
MKLIVEYDKQKKVSLLQYSSRIETFGQGFAYIEVNKRHLNRLNNLIKGIEENSIIQLKEQGSTLDSIFTEENDIILAFIGHRQTNPQITHYYSINTNTMKPVTYIHPHLMPNHKKYCISCFNENNKTDTLGIIRCIKFLSDLSKKCNKPLVVYASIGALRGKYNPRRLWEQVRTTEGNVYTSEQINAALASENPGEIIRLPEGESMSTAMAAISGGWNESLGYRGVAPQAEFLIARIRPVSENLQRVYGGMPSPTAITMFDALIGLLQLGNYALNQGRPLSLIFPFNGNLDSHDAALYTQQELSRLTKRVGLTIIVPTGDEANKRHHFEIQGEQEGLRIVNLEVEQPNQNVLVAVYQLGGTIRSMNLYAPGTSDFIDLGQSGISMSGLTTIYSSGSNISFLNGSIRTLFRLENPSVGTWRMELDVNMGATSRIQMWMSQEELNPYVRFNPNNALTTMGSTAAIPYVMSVGGYDFNTQTVLSMSGRGDPQSSNIIPMLVTYGKGILAPCTSREWIGVTGTVPAASIMAGAVAAVYQKYIEEAPNQIPNTVVMNRLILNVLIQIQILQYPNPNQGYGMFTLETLLQLLAETL